MSSSFEDFSSQLSSTGYPLPTSFSNSGHAIFDPYSRQQDNTMGTTPTSHLLIEDLKMPELLKNSHVARLFKDWQEASQQALQGVKVQQDMYQDLQELKREVERLKMPRSTSPRYFCTIRAQFPLIYYLKALPLVIQYLILVHLRSHGTHKPLTRHFGHLKDNQLSSLLNTHSKSCGHLMTAKRILSPESLQKTHRDLPSARHFVMKMG